MLTAVTGINWGDEGKGRVIDLLAEHADVVARYQGGNNAGHTVVTEQGKFILNLLPSGILHPDVVCVLGAGMVIDLDHLAGEMDAIEERGVKVGSENLKLSDKATISMPWHKVQDGLEEDRLAQKGAAFGSTRRGIAYAYSDKYRKKTLRLGDLLHLDEKRVQDRLHMILESKNLELGGCYHQESFGVDGPNAPIELGVNSAQLFSRAISSEFISAPILISHAFCGIFSPVALSSATRLKIESILYLLTIPAYAFASRASSNSKGPASPNALLSRISDATTLASP